MVTNKILRSDKYYKCFYIISIIAIILGILSLFWQFWLVSIGIFYTIAILFFSTKDRDYGILNIHVAALSILLLHALPSTFLIIERQIPLTNIEMFRLFLSICVGIVGYVFGVLSLGKLFKINKNMGFKLSHDLNSLFWLTYKYRYLLTAIVLLVILKWGFSPYGMSYAESVIYRKGTPGALQYSRLLITYVFSALTLAMISIIGDVKKYRKLSFLSYLLIILVILSIIGGHRIWIITILFCFLLAFYSILGKRRLVLALILVFIILTFVASGAVRAARSGASFTKDFKNFYEYFINIKNKSLIDLMWGFSDFTAPFSTFITLIKNVPSNISYDFYAPLKDFSLLVPTIIYPNRPLPYSQWYVKTFYPELFAAGRGLTFYIIGFGYLFAGPIGVFIYLFLFGALFEWINRFFKMVGGVAGVFLYSCFFAQLFTFVRGCGFVSFIKTGVLLNFLIPLILLYLFVTFLNVIKFRKKTG